MRRATLCLAAGVLSLLSGPAFAATGMVYYLPFQTSGEGTSTLTNSGTAGGTATTFGPNAGGFTNTTLIPAGGLWARNLLSVSGNYSPALQLPASTNRFNMKTAGDKITVAAWIKLNSISSGYQGVATKNQDNSSENSWWFGVYNGTLSFYTTSPYKWIEGKGSVSAGTWTHVAMTWEAGSTITFYVNAVNSGTDTASAPAGAGGKPFGIGFFNAAQVSHLNGLVDEYRVYDYILSPEQIQAVMVERPGAPAGAMIYLQ